MIQNIPRSPFHAIPYFLPWQMKYSTFEYFVHPCRSYFSNWKKLSGTIIVKLHTLNGKRFEETLEKSFKFRYESFTHHDSTFVKERIGVAILESESWWKSTGRNWRATCRPDKMLIENEVDHANISTDGERNDQSRGDPSLAWRRAREQSPSRRFTRSTTPTWLRPLASFRRDFCYACEIFQPLETIFIVPLSHGLLFGGVHRGRFNIFVYDGRVNICHALGRSWRENEFINRYGCRLKIYFSRLSRLFAELTSFHRIYSRHNRVTRIKWQITVVCRIFLRLCVRENYKFLVPTATINWYFKNGDEITQRNVSN